jgi:hypothetical protein
MKNIILIKGIHIFFSYFILPASQILLLDFLLSRLFSYCLFSYFFTPIVPSSGKHNMEKKKQRKGKLIVKKKQKNTRAKKRGKKKKKLGLTCYHDSMDGKPMQKNIELVFCVQIHEK